MMADEAFGPSFWHLDGCNMDDDNFDIHRRKREEWKEEQREWEALSRKMDAQWAERQRLGVSYLHSGEDAENWACEMRRADRVGFICDRELAEIGETTLVSRVGRIGEGTDEFQPVRPQ